MFYKIGSERAYDVEPVYYVYHLVNPLTDVPFYVGKGKNRRCYQHLTDKMSYSRNKRLTGHIRNLRDAGIEPKIIKIKECMNEESAFLLEEVEILKYGRIGFDDGGVLLNFLISNRPERKMGPDNGFYGKQHTEETKRLISVANTGSIRSPEHRRSISAAQKGKPKSEEHRRKIAEKSRGRTVKEETKEKLREYNLREDVLRKNIESKQKEWIVTKPDGNEEFVINLSDYCVEHNLCRAKMYSVASGNANHHKGYKCRKVDGQ
jgi:hypothetical protein